MMLHSLLLVTLQEMCIAPPELLTLRQQTLSPRRVLRLLPFNFSKSSSKTWFLTLLLAGFSNNNFEKSREECGFRHNPRAGSCSCQISHTRWQPRDSWSQLVCQQYIFLHPRDLGSSLMTTNGLSLLFQQYIFFLLDAQNPQWSYYFPTLDKVMNDTWPSGSAFIQYS